MKLRAVVLEEESGCYRCGQFGLADDQVDHVDGDVTNNDRGNLRRIHRTCHNSKTALESVAARNSGA